MLCLAGLSSALFHCLHDVLDVEFSRIVPWAQTFFFFFFLIPDSLWRGLFAKKMQQNDVLLGIAVSSGNI